MSSLHVQPGLAALILALGCSGEEGPEPPRPTMALSPASLEFTSGLPGAQTVAISNAGDGTVAGLSTSVEYTEAEHGWLSLSLSGPEAPATLVADITAGPEQPGTYHATAGSLDHGGQLAAISGGDLHRHSCRHRDESS